MAPTPVPGVHHPVQTALPVSSTSGSPFPQPVSPVSASTLRTKVRYTRPPQPGQDLWMKADSFEGNLRFVNRIVEMHDARHMAGLTSIDREGFEIHVAGSRISSWDDEEAVRSVYYSEAVELVKHATGARHALVFDHTFRRADKESLNLSGRPPARDPVNLVHVDYTAASAVKRLSDFVGESEAERCGRFAIVNVWRPIVDVVYDRPLGLLDATTLQAEDLSCSKILFADRVGENQAVHPNEEVHKWHYIPHQRANEVFIFKQFDSNTTKTQWTPHTGFVDPTAPKDGGWRKRESVELRMFVFFERDAYEVQRMVASFSEKLRIGSSPVS